VERRFTSSSSATVQVDFSGTNSDAPDVFVAEIDADGEWHLGQPALVNVTDDTEEAEGFAVLADGKILVITGPSLAEQPASVGAQFPAQEITTSSSHG
jgi:hypothetical protein